MSLLGMAGNSTGYVVSGSGSMIMAMAIQMVIVIFTFGLAVLGIYIALLLIKFLKRGIKYYDMKLSDEKANSAINHK